MLLCVSLCDPLRSFIALIGLSSRSLTETALRPLPLHLKREQGIRPKVVQQPGCPATRLPGNPVIPQPYRTMSLIEDAEAR